MKERIISLLSEKYNHFLTLEEIIQKTGIRDIEQLKRILNEFVNEGILDYNEQESKYMLFENSKLKKGYIIRDGKEDYLVVIDTRTYKIDKNNLNDITYHDEVVVELENNIAKIKRIIKREDKNYVGTVELLDNHLIIKDKRLGDIDVENSQLSLKEGDKVLITHKNGKIYLEKVIGHTKEPGIDIKEIIYNHGFNIDFSQKIKEELEVIPASLSEEIINKEIANGRDDLREELIFTIDGDNTKDMDDAVSVKKNQDGTYELGVYIADVAHFVPEDSEINKESIKRGTSIYPPGKVVSEIPSVLSTGICSLNPNTDRLVLYDYIIFDKDGNILSYDIREGIINSKKKMTYRNVNEILDGKSIEGYNEYREVLKTMHELATIIENKLKMNGFLEFNVGEVNVKLDEAFKPVNLYKRNSGKAEKIIEYFMLAANIERSVYANEKGLPWIYRIHNEPNEDKLRKSYKLIKFNKYADKPSEKLQECIDYLQEDEAREIKSRLLITCLSKAEFSYNNTGHFALGIKTYGQGTSPIRRGGDLRNQRIIKSYLHDGYEETIKKYGEVVKIEADHFTKMEKLAESVERSVTQLKISEYMERYLGEEFEGHISQISKRGFWVTLENGVEGYISLEELPEDSYQFNGENAILKGNDNTFRIFDKCTILVKDVDLQKKRVNFALVNDKTKHDSNAKVLQKRKAVVL